VVASLSSWVWTGIGIVGFIILVLLAFWPARVARRKGHSWLLFFIFSLFLFFPALIVAYLMPNRYRQERRRERREESGPAVVGPDNLPVVRPERAWT
jgi:hypothetical protein